MSFSTRYVSGMAAASPVGRGPPGERDRSGHLQEVLQQLLAFHGQDRLGVELYAPDRQVTVAHAHDFTLGGPGGLV